jgi:hypothetical protein
MTNTLKAIVIYSVGVISGILMVSLLENRSRLRFIIAEQTLAQHLVDGSQSSGEASASRTATTTALLRNAAAAATNHHHPTTMTAFEETVQSAYQLMMDQQERRQEQQERRRQTPPPPPTHNTTLRRASFNLSSSWTQQSTGGLQDADRELLAEMYSNAGRCSNTVWESRRSSPITSA